MNDGPPGRARLIAAFLAIYVVWGSTYLFMRFTVETVPPLGMSGLRFFTAGALLYLLAWKRASGNMGDVPLAQHALAGVLLTAGNASISWAVQRVPSGVTSLLVAMTPCWIVFLDWWRPHGRRPRAGVFAGVVLGVIGTLLLIGPGSVGGAPVDSLGALVALLGTLAWASGSIYARSVPKLSSSMHSSAIQMMTGGTVVLVVGLLLGEFRNFHLADVSLRSGLSMLYLILVGSLVGFSAYMYLLGVTSPALVATYAFVNPVVAVLLGAVFAGEQISPRILSAGAVIVGAVALITLNSGTRRASLTRLTEEAPVREAP